MTEFRHFGPLAATQLPKRGLSWVGRNKNMSDNAPSPAQEPTSAPEEQHVAASGSPTDFLKGVVGKRVIVRLTSGVDYQGRHPQTSSLVSSVDLDLL